MKKKKFGKTGLIIIFAVLFLGIIGVILINNFLNKSISGDIIVCFTTNQYEHYNIHTEQRVEYVDGKFKNLELNFKYEIINKKLAQNIGLMKEKFEEALPKFGMLESLEYEFKTNNNELNLKYSMSAEDYLKFENSMKDKDEEINKDDILYRDKEKFIKHIETLGGECFYE